jgi:LemA protein
MITWIVLGGVAVVGLYVMFTYNGFVAMTQRAKEAWADIDVQLKRRYDLIPNLVETVKGYAAHERAVLDEVTSARANATSTHIDAGAISADQMAAMAGAESALTGALGKLIAVAEAYPDLKANTNFAQLQSELSDTENKIQAARRFYNGTVRELATGLQMFPGNIVGRLFNFATMAYFELPENSTEREPVKVSF